MVYKRILHHKNVLTLQCILISRIILLKAAAHNAVNQEEKIMKIAVIGATGKQGRLLVKEALRRGHIVTAIVRNASKLEETNVSVIEKDIMSLTYADLAEQDAILDAIGVWTTEEFGLYQTSLEHLSNLLSGKPNRLLVVGGAGGLYADETRTLRVVETSGFPEDWKPMALSMMAAFETLKKRVDVKWTFMSPPAFFNAEGERTGSYRLGGDVLLVNGAGKSEISYADYAIAMLDEAEKGLHIKARVTVVSV